MTFPAETHGRQWGHRRGGFQGDLGAYLGLIFRSSQDTTNISLLSAMRHAELHPCPRKTVATCQDHYDRHPGHPCYAGARRTFAQSSRWSMKLLHFRVEDGRIIKNMEYTPEN